jgi:hypothetical protein
MTLDAYLDGKHLDLFATNSGTYEFFLWLNTLDKRKYPALVEFGTESLQAVGPLKEELAIVMRESPPKNRDLLEIAQHLQELLEPIADPEAIFVISNGEMEDDADDDEDDDGDDDDDDDY